MKQPPKIPSSFYKGEKMKIGEIKIQSLMLIFPSLDFEYDPESLSEAVSRLKANGLYTSYISASVGAINRALAVIEGEMGYAPSKITHLTGDEMDLDLKEGVCELIPYLVKADLLATEAPSEAQASRKIFYEEIKKHLDTPPYSETVYCQRSILK